MRSSKEYSVTDVQASRTNGTRPAFTFTSGPSAPTLRSCEPGAKPSAASALR